LTGAAGLAASCKKEHYFIHISATLSLSGNIEASQI